ncbi:MAG: M48 family metallopeptidase [Bacteroidota bacterium]
MTSFRRSSKAKTYNRIKLTTGVSSSVFVFIFLLLLVLSSWSREIDRFAHTVANNSYAAMFVFVLTIGLLQACITIPLAFFSGYAVEHRYHLSNQTVGRWFLERIKGYAVGLPLTLAVLGFFYFSLRSFGSWWWLPVATILTLLSVILARIAPVIIFPLFYKFVPLGEGALKERILGLCANTGIRIDGIFTFNLSKNTRKANAGFAGIGKARRIILADTLVNDFTDEEIETVFAHEIGHYVQRHILSGILTGTISTFISLFLAAQFYHWSVLQLGFSSVSQLAALPLLALWLSLLGLVFSPLGNLLSRYRERQADTYAVRATDKRDAFVTALRRLESINLADPEPHPLVEYLFYTHLPMAKRIRFIESL